MISFSGMARDSLYGSDNGYMLSAGRGAHASGGAVTVVGDEPDELGLPSVAPASYYYETAIVERQRRYSFAAPIRGTTTSCWLTAREAESFRVKVVDVESIYAQ